MTSADDVAAPTIYDLNAPQGKLDVRRLPRLTLQAVRIAWAAGRGEFVASTVLQAIAGFACRRPRTSATPTLRNDHVYVIISGDTPVVEGVSP